MIYNSTFDIEEKISKSYPIIAGIDEVGCGAWAGPIVAGASIFLNFDKGPSWIKEIKDSKKLSKKKRELLFYKIKEEESILISTGETTIEEINRMSIRKAVFLAMERALLNLPIKPSYILVDGSHVPSFINIKCPIKTIIKGDNISISIAAASIIAKVTRDHIMIDLDKHYPMYFWSSNMGYGTEKHFKALNNFGITKHHRLNFSPIKRIISNY